MGICTALHDMIVVEENDKEYYECAQCGYTEFEDYEVDGDALYDAMIDDLVASA